MIADVTAPEGSIERDRSRMVAEVLLHGSRVEYCWRVDTETGELGVLAVDRDGSPLVSIDEHGNRELIYEIVQVDPGAIKVVPKPGMTLETQ